MAAMASMDGDIAGGSGGGRSKDGSGSRFGSAVLLPFPSSTAIQDPSSHLSSLRDNHSNFHNVAKSCLFLNQFASHGSSAFIEDTTSLTDSTSGDATSSLFHDGSFAFGLSESIMALLDCIREHDDRRCRIMACKTSAIVGRSAFARLRHSPHLWSTKAQGGGGSSSSGDHHNAVTAARLEDEVGTDVPMALITCALDDQDDGVAAAALEALGYLVLSTTSTLHTLAEDELLTDMAGLVSCARPTPYAPTLSLLTDEDSRTALTELQTRVLENILAPRLLQIVSRLAHFESVQQIGMALPTVTAGLVHISKTSPGTIYQMDRASYSKRWIELDYVTIVDTVVRGTLLPVMQSSAGKIGAGKGNGNAVVATRYVGPAAAMATIRLTNACPGSSWSREAIDWVILVLKEEYNSSKADVPQPVEGQLTCLSSILIASRAIPLVDRLSSTLFFVAECIKELPYSTRAPLGVTSAGLLFDLGGGSTGGGSSSGFLQYRSPCRPALWAEMALSFFVDGPAGEINNLESVKVRGQMMSAFLKHIKVVNWSSVLREEFIAAFCTVAFYAGRRHKRPSNISSVAKTQLMGREEDLEEWLWLSISLLRIFEPCIGWGDTPSFTDEEVTMLVSCQVAYTRLLQDVLHSAGLLDPDTSVSVKLTPSCLPPSVLWGQLEEASEYLVQCGSMPVVESAVDPLKNLVDDIVKTEVKGQGIVSHHMRLFLLSLAADRWVQQAEYASSQKSTGASELALNSDSAKYICVAISPRRLFNKLLEANKSVMESYSKNKKDRYKRFAQETVTASVACVENMALIACFVTSRFGGSSETKEVLNLSVQSLKGRSANDSDSPILPLCQTAIERIEATYKAGGRNSSSSPSTSPLVPNEFKRRQIISSSRINQGDEAFEEGYLVQLSRQMIEARVDRCILTYPLIASFPAAVRKQNWLRLSTPPLPPSRDPQISTSLIPKFTWGDNVTLCSAGSDPAAITLAHSIRRVMRYDGEEEFRLSISVRVHNVVAAEIPEGLRLEVGIVEENVATSSDSMDPTSVEIQRALQGSDDEAYVNNLSSAAVIYRSELNSGDYVTWELTMNPLNFTGTIVLQPSITYRAMEVEPPLASWVTSTSKQKEDEETSVVSGQSQKSGTSLGGGDKGGKVVTDQKENIVIPCQHVRLSPMIGLQPDPFVFFRDPCGDLSCFRYLWSRMPFQLGQLKLTAVNSDGNDDADEDEKLTGASNDAIRLAAISTLRFGGDIVPGGMVTRLWAFSSPQGKRVMFVLAEQGNDKSTALHARGDDRQLLLALAGTSTARKAVVSALQPGFDAI
mmetsp:Transcript_13061/g.31877  ORF Transcript_13061/g.31877 Transcript_13061/m.31877 type:complete len:1307 (+) Transcript_13061:88-4008(+)